MYEPTTGRFSTLDPFFGNLNDPQSFHKYAYVHGDPVNNIDPTGMYSGAAVGAIYSMFVSGVLGAPPRTAQRPMDGSRILTDGGSYRMLTRKEQLIIGYFYRAAFPGLFDRGGHNGDQELLRLARVMSEVKLWDQKSIQGWHVLRPKYIIAFHAIDTFGAGAVSLGTDQYYARFPRANEVDNLPLLAHELFHSYHADRTGGTTSFLSIYLLDSAAAYVESGAAYHGNFSEIFGHAIQDALLEMLDNPTFVAAF
ncbi:MAG: hypothetical protein K1Y02_25865 [Candidatus Hydrogenedentes bacterium]|nr:hypothetical protein [Candidatus Hydrogenedentota bacterium]